MTTEQEAREAIQAAAQVQADLHDKASYYFRRRFEIDEKWQEEWRDGGYYPPQVTNISFGTKTVTVYCSAPACGRGCCGTNTNHFTFPLAALWEDWSVTEEKILARKAAAEAAEAAREAKEAEEQAAQEAEWERRTYERLREKFESSS